MARAEASENAALRFLRLAGVPRRIPRGVIDTIESCRHQGKVHPEQPDVEHVLLALQERYPDDDETPVERILYVQYLGMREYATCDMAAEAPVEARFRSLESMMNVSMGLGSSTDYAEALSALPVAERLQEALWTSLAHSRKYYTADLTEAVGRYLVAVHVDHTRSYGRVFRSEFLMACVWTGTADWASDVLDVYRATTTMGYEAISQAVRCAADTHLSCIRILALDDYAERAGTALQWWEPERQGRYHPADEATLDFTEYPPASVMLDEAAERLLNASLERAFAAQ